MADVMLLCAFSYVSNHFLCGCRGPLALVTMLVFIVEGKLYAHKMSLAVVLLALLLLPSPRDVFLLCCSQIKPTASNVLKNEAISN